MIGQREPQVTLEPAGLRVTPRPSAHWLWLLEASVSPSLRGSMAVRGLWHGSPLTPSVPIPRGSMEGVLSGHPSLEGGGRPAHHRGLGSVH